MLNKKILKSEVIGTHICSDCHHAVQLWHSLEYMIHYSVSSTAMSQELSTYWELVADTGIFYFFFRYEHFMLMWNTFLMEKFVA